MPAGRYGLSMGYLYISFVASSLVGDCKGPQFAIQQAVLI